MKNIIKTAIITLTVVAVSMFTGCLESEAKKPSADAITQARQERQMKEATAQAGLPAIKNFQEKKMMKMLYELRDREDLVCYAYLVNEINGEVGQFLGKCIGYGLPASTQYSNPEKTVVNRYTTSGYAFGSLPQAEPNGLFMPEGLSATWLMMLDPKTNEPRPVYIEPTIIVSPFPLHK